MNNEKIITTKNFIVALIVFSIAGVFAFPQRTNAADGFKSTIQVGASLNWDSFNLGSDSASYDDDVKYKSSNKKVATVNGYGIIKAKKPGWVTIKRSQLLYGSNYYTEECRLHVVNTIKFAKSKCTIVKIDKSELLKNVKIIGVNSKEKTFKVENNAGKEISYFGFTSVSCVKLSSSNTY